MTDPLAYFRVLDPRILAQQARWSYQQTQQIRLRNAYNAAARTMRATDPMCTRTCLLSAAAGFRIASYAALLDGDRSLAAQHRQSAAQQMRHAVGRARV